jgi:Domain of unknown function (DUF4352)
MRGWVLVIGSAWLLGACGGPPTPSDILAMPGRSDLTDAHFTVQGTENGVPVRGDGVVIVKPKRAMSLHLQTQLGALPAELDVIQADGVTYQRLGLDKWTKRTGSVPTPSWQDATDPRVAAVESLGGAKAWHIRAERSGGGYEMWVRQSDGYPLRVITSSAGGAVFTFDFHDYNRGSVVKAPPPFQVKAAPKNLSGRVGDTLALNTARVTLVSADLDARSTDFVQPRPGNRFVVVEVAIENTGRDLLSTYVDWRLTDASGYSWPRSVAVRSPSFLGGELPPAAVSRGFLTYEVTRTASALTVTVRIDDDSAAFALGAAD